MVCVGVSGCKDRVNRGFPAANGVVCKVPPVVTVTDGFINGPIVKHKQLPPQKVLPSQEGV